MKTLISKLVSISITIMLILCNSSHFYRQKVGAISASFDVVVSRYIRIKWKSRKRNIGRIMQILFHVTRFHVRAKIDPWPCLRMLKFPYVSGRIEGKKGKYHIVKVFWENIVPFVWTIYMYKQNSIGFDSVNKIRESSVIIRFLVFI